MASIEKKLRIQLFDNDFNMLSDRLISQNIELTNGPKEKHNGPLKVELSLFEQEDVEKALIYLNKLKGNLPLEKKEKKIKSKEINVESREELLKVVVNEANDQEQLIKILRLKGFKFLTYDHIKDMGLGIDIKPIHEDYQFMLYCLKEAKIASNDKYDPKLVFGIKILGDKVNKIQIYLHGEFKEKITMDWPSKIKVSFQKMDLIKFPPYMKSEERLKFRNELRMLHNNTEKIPSKFFGRWIDDVEFKDKEEIKSKISVA
jgi:hypothetical protein